jgi:hypothetical protein
VQWFFSDFAWLQRAPGHEAPLWFEFSPRHIILIETRFHQYFMVQRSLGAPLQRI